jgi:hypothetical protein
MSRCYIAVQHLALLSSLIKRHFCSRGVSSSNRIAVLIPLAGKEE